MAQPDRLERVTDLLLVLLDTPRPLSLREIADRVPGYPDSHGARRQAFERDKRLLRDEGVPVLVEFRSAARTSSGTGSTPTRTTCPTSTSSPRSRRRSTWPWPASTSASLSAGMRCWKLGVGGDRPAARRHLPLVDLPSSTGLPALPVLFEAVRHRAVVPSTTGARSARSTWPASGSAAATGTWSAATGTGPRPAPSGSTGSTGCPR